MTIETPWQLSDGIGPLLLPCKKDSEGCGTPAVATPTILTAQSVACRPLRPEQARQLGVADNQLKVALQAKMLPRLMAAVHRSLPRRDVLGQDGVPLDQDAVV